MKQNNTATLWSALLPDERLEGVPMGRLQCATSPNYRVTTPGGRVSEVEISDTRLIIILKAKG